jgi:hypothetical protein
MGNRGQETGKIDLPRCCGRKGAAALGKAAGDVIFPAEGI